MLFTDIVFQPKLGGTTGDKIEVVYREGPNIRRVRGGFKASNMFSDFFIIVSGKGLEEKDEEGNWILVAPEKNIKELSINYKHVVTATLLDEWVSEED